MLDVTLLSGVRDSKLLTIAQRDAALTTVLRVAIDPGVGWSSADEVDLLGLTAANELAMVRAVRALGAAPDYVLVDAFRLRSLDLPSAQSFVAIGSASRSRRPRSSPRCSATAGWKHSGDPSRLRLRTASRVRRHSTSGRARRTRAARPPSVVVRATARDPCVMIDRRGVGMHGEELARVT